MPDYTGNSNVEKDKPNRRVPEKVVTGDVTIKAPGVATKFKRIFFGGDMKTAAVYVFGDVLIPAMQRLVLEAASKGLDQLIYGSDRRPHSSRSTYQPRVQYHNPNVVQAQSRPYAANRPIDRWRREDPINVGNIVVASRADADNVIEGMINIVDSYEVVSVADLYELLGQPTTHVDHKWGWTRLSGIESRQVKDGYHIWLPPVEEIS